LLGTLPILFIDFHPAVASPPASPPTRG
jgi:hypothetical protein